MLWKRKFTDDQLVAAIRQGGKEAEKAIHSLYKDHRNQVIQFILSKNGSENDALDVFQDAVISLVTSIEEGKFKGGSTVKTYLFAISKRLWYRKFNRNTRDDKFRNDFEQKEVTDRDPETLLLKKDRESKIEEVMNQLKPRSREVLMLWIRNYSMKEIAEIMGFKNEQVARNKKSNSLKELKDLIGKEHPVRKLIEELK
ncbi:MAG: sigma-70 family RNA polymerase sigma factor [Bacteroidota bacterium]